MSEIMAIHVAPINRLMVSRTQPSQQDRTRAKRQLFGAPEKGEINEIYRQEECQRRKEISRYIIEARISKTGLEPKAVKSVAESLIEKESREYQEKLVLRNKENAFGLSSRGERPKPYARQPAITDYYNPRKVVACNNSRISDVRSEEPNDVVAQQPIQENVGIENYTSASIPAVVVTTSESPSSSEHEKSQEQISLHTMTTDHSAKLV